MKFLEKVKRESDGAVFKTGDKVFGIGAGEYYIGVMYKNERYLSGICVSGYKNKEDLFKYINFPENAHCGFNDLSKIEHII